MKYPRRNIVKNNLVAAVVGLAESIVVLLTLGLYAPKWRLEAMLWLAQHDFREESQHGNK